MRLTELETALKPLEAMAMEKLVAVSRVGGLTELVMDKQTGYVFDPGNLEDMKSVVYSALEDKEGSDKIRKYARAWVEQNRNWFNNVSQHIRVYEKLVVK